MKNILKPLFNILTGDVAICNNVLYNYLILLIVGEIAFHFAFSIVGDAYKAGVISGKESGSILHWIIRFMIYIMVAYLLRSIIWIYNFVLIIPHWIWWVLVVIIIGGMLFVIAFKYMKKEKHIDK